jgi:hypothetical protein
LIEDKIRDKQQDDETIHREGNAEGRCLDEYTKIANQVFCGVVMPKAQLK